MHLFINLWSALTLIETQGRLSCAIVVLCGELSDGISTERPIRKIRAVPVCSTVAVAT